MKINRQVYEAALRLQSPEMVPFLNWIRTERQGILEKLTTAPAEVLPILQGEARQLGAILNLVESARVELDRNEGLIARMFK